MRMNRVEVRSKRLARYAIQVAVVAVLASASNLFTDRLSFRSPTNALWMIALPLLLGIILNRTWAERMLMAAVLVVVSLLTSVAIGVNFTSYN